MRNSIYALTCIIAIGLMGYSYWLRQQKESTYEVFSLAAENPSVVHKLVLTNNEEALGEPPMETLLQMPNLRKLEAKRLYWKTLDSSFFKTCNHLEELIVQDNYIQHLPHTIRYCQSLHYLDLSENYFESLPDGINDLPHLETLNLYNNSYLKTLPNISLPALKTLNLSATGIKNLPDTFDVPNLQTLDLSGTNIAVLPPKIEELEQLEELKLGGYYSATNIDIEHSIFPKGLKSLEIRGVNIPISFWEKDGQWDDLESLDLWGCVIDSIPDNFIPFKKLKSLRLYSAEIADEDIEQIERLLPGTKVEYDRGW